MMTIKEYAASRDISYEAARMSLKRHDKELSEHIHKHGKTRYLDDTGIEILDSYRISKTPEIYTGNGNQEATIDSLKNQIILLQNQIIELQKENKASLEASVKLQMIEEHTGKLEKENQDLREELQSQQEELRSYQKTIFGLYRKVASR